jgi:dCMP deaminase
MKQKFIDYFMDVADRTSQLSHAIRLQVGAIIVKDDRIISIGYNGMPGGWDNMCEDEIGQVLDDNGNIIEARLKTKPEVLHAEMNCLMKTAKSTDSSDGAVMFCTHAPCIDCAKAIFQAGISEIVYKNVYRSDDGLNFLKKCGVKLTKLIESDK